MLIGHPEAFSLAATGPFFGFIGIELDRSRLLGNLAYRPFGIISNDLWLAIPFFTFMGAIRERCGLAADLLCLMPGADWCFWAQAPSAIYCGGQITTLVRQRI